MRDSTVVRGAVWGALGFGAGWAIAGAAGDFMLFAFAVAGALGAAALAYAFGDVRRYGPYASAGAVGYFVGFFVAFVLVLFMWEPPVLEMALVGLMGGAAGGLLLGAVVAGWRGALLVSAVSALGFAVGYAAVADTGLFPDYASCCTAAQTVVVASFNAVIGLVGGAATGAAAAWARRWR